MKTLALALLILACIPAHGRTLWEEDGFKLQSAKWENAEWHPMWTGLVCSIVMPDDSYFAITGEGALEIYLPCKGWVEDKGILIRKGCETNPNNPGGDTLNGTFCILSEHRCDSQGQRVIMLVRLPRMFTSGDCRPTEARWVRRKVQYNVEDTDDPVTDGDDSLSRWF